MIAVTDQKPTLRVKHCKFPSPPPLFITHLLIPLEGQVARHGMYKVWYRFIQTTEEPTESSTTPSTSTIIYWVILLVLSLSDSAEPQSWYTWLRGRSLDSWYRIVHIIDVESSSYYSVIQINRENPYSITPSLASSNSIVKKPKRM